MTAPIILSCAIAAGWVILALLAPFLGRRHQNGAFWITIVTGVPVLGWLTWAWGPGVGVGFFIIGMILLQRRCAPRNESVPTRHPEV